MELAKGLYGLIETAKANGIEPWAYLNHVFDVLPRATLDAEVEALLPRNIDRSTLSPGSVATEFSKRLRYFCSACSTAW